MLAAKALGIELELEKVDLFNGENKTPEFLEVCPERMGIALSCHKVSPP